MSEPDSKNAFYRGRTWSQWYAESGPLWGNEPSIVADLFLNRVSAPCRGIDVGCGYARDSLACAKRGHQFVAMDPAYDGLLKGKKAYEQLRRKRPIGGTVDFVQGTIHAFRTDAAAPKFDAILSNRTLHMMSDPQLKGFVCAAADLLKTGGYLILSAASPSDFSPDKESWQPGKEGRMAQRKDGSPPPVYFLSQAFLTSLFAPYFKIHDLFEGTDPVDAPKGAMRLNIMCATRNATP
ncbi:MAG: class I SAM-dependent methyltransferase [Alphaproteobacteria bacterium]|nr:class I SAM-dependent methyltransferase [Alphaproteobacteria bacterium]